MKVYVVEHVVENPINETYIWGIFATFDAAKKYVNENNKLKINYFYPCELGGWATYYLIDGTSINITEYEIEN